MPCPFHVSPCECRDAITGKYLNPPATRQRFQHFTETCSCTELEPRLAEWEFEGWELVTAVLLPSGDDFDPAEYRLFFKRPYEAE